MSKKVKKVVDIFRYACIIYKCPCEKRKGQAEKIESQKTQKAEKFSNKNLDKRKQTWYNNFC